MQHQVRLNPSEWADTSLADELTSLTGVILFDGSCKFCRRVVKSLLAVDGGAPLRLCSVRSDRGRALATGLGRRPEDTFAFITAGKTYFDVSAYEAILALTRQSRPLAWLIARSPAVISKGLYRWVASHRPFLSALLAPGAPAPIDRKWFIAGGDGDGG
jgi:predicted DCC family thiol-disulfide oxidoreductase YuxK